MKIVVLDGFTLNPGDNPWNDLLPLGDVEVYERTPADQVIGRAVDADILVINKIILSADVLEQLPNLKFVAVTATGFNVVDVEAARARNIPVANVPVYGTDSVAQFVAVVEAAQHAHDRCDAAAGADDRAIAARHRRCARTVH